MTVQRRSLASAVGGHRFPPQKPKSICYMCKGASNIKAASIGGLFKFWS